MMTASAKSVTAAWSEKMEGFNGWKGGNSVGDVMGFEVVARGDGEGRWPG